MKQPNTSKLLIRLAGLICLHVLVNIGVGMFHWLDSITFSYQFTFSLIHISFIGLVIRFVILPSKQSKVKTYLGVGVLFVFVIRQFTTPVFLEEALHACIMSRGWLIAEQTFYGWPFPILRVYGGEMQQTYEVPPFLLQVDHVCLNGYLLAVILGVGGLMVDAFIRKRTR